MKPETLKALKGSIRKWQRIVDGSGEDDGCDNCPLCDRFNYAPPYSCTRDDGGECCPVFVATGEPYCSNSPYPDWALATGEVKDPYAFPHKVESGEMLMCAVLELEFLKSLLPGAK
jgi:hypothetical protein